MIPNNFIYLIHEEDEEYMQHLGQKMWKEETIFGDNFELNQVRLD